MIATWWKPGAKHFFLVSHMGSGAQECRLSSTAFKAQWLGAGSEADQLGFELAAVWDAGIRGCGFSPLCHNTGFSPFLLWTALKPTFLLACTQPCTSLWWVRNVDSPGNHTFSHLLCLLWPCLCTCLAVSLHLPGGLWVLHSWFYIVSDGRLKAPTIQDVML